MERVRERIKAITAPRWRLFEPAQSLIAELNPVLARSLYPRALPLGGEPTAADRQVLADLVHAEQRRDDQAIGVGFGDHASTQAASTPPGTPTSHSDMARSAFATGWSGTPPSHP